MLQSSSQEHAVVLKEWPQPEVVAETHIQANEHKLLVRYNTAHNKIAVIRFPLCCYLMFGAPNDEALGGHALSGRGLEFYSVHEVKNSSLIQMLEQRNAVHLQHNRQGFLKDKKHYVFTFQDSTLDCVVIESEWFKPTISVVDSEDEVKCVWRLGDAS